MRREPRPAKMNGERRRLAVALLPAESLFPDLAESHVPAPAEEEPGDGRDDDGEIVDHDVHVSTP